MWKWARGRRGCWLGTPVIAPSGRFSLPTISWTLSAPVSITQQDVRELQLAKAAIAGGIQMLSQKIGASKLSRIYLAGAFGNYINRAAARKIGLIDFPQETTMPVGNTALLGAKIALFHLESEPATYTNLRQRIHHVALNLDPGFQDFFVQHLAFPQAAFVSNLG